MVERILIHRPHPDADLARFGGKAAALALLVRAKLPVPDFVVVDPDAAAADGLDPRHATAAGPTLMRALEDALPARDRPDALYAVRSSGLDEDGAEHAFAGQFDSFLFVRRAALAARIAEVWRSGFSERVLAYRREHGLAAASAPAVLVQCMVDADTAGVAFSADPVSGRRSVAVVSAVLGLGSALVGGDVDADTWRVDRDGQIVDRVIVPKERAHRADPDGATGVTEVDVDASVADAPAIDDATVLEVAALARRCAEHFGRPQDIEWARRDGQIVLLQSRPVTTLGQLPDPDGVRRLWDNSNIVESYSGITTPLTFSFALNAYEHVYREFCALLSVPSWKIEANRIMFARMLGSLRGRVYYNLMNWYRMLAMLPGFNVNREFMEGMMGVREGLPDEILAEIEQDSRGWLRDRFDLARSVFGLIGAHWGLRRAIRRFHARLESALAVADPPLESMRIDELVADYRNLEAKLLTRWDAPLVNDFFAMIFFGVLGRLTATWCNDENGTLQNDLVAAQGGMISAEPAQRVLEMARRLTAADADGTAAEALRSAPVETALEVVASQPDLHRAFEEYLDRFGDRCLDELKLESPTLRDDPAPLLRAIGNTAAMQQRQGNRETGVLPAQLAEKAEARVDDALSGGPWWRRRIFAWVLRNARDRVRDRENLRFERTRLFGRVRRIFVQIGQRLHAEGRLQHPRDVFYLEVEEILGFAEGTITADDVEGLARVRRDRYAAYVDMPAPATRFETRGAVPLGNAMQAAEASAPAAVDDPNTLTGIGCCPGIVRGPVRVIRDPRGASLADGEILVAERTDPGWILLFPSAAALLVERGSLLSHSAIVAREMGIPAIVSIPDLTARLRDGELVEMDGATGRIRRLEGEST